MNPMLAKLAEKGVDFSKEIFKYINRMQDQIDELNKIIIEDHKRIIDNLQKQLDFIIDMAKNNELSYNKKLKLLDKMDDLQNKINEKIKEKQKFEQKEKEKIVKEKTKKWQIILEILFGIFPFTFSYRAIKKNRAKKKKLKDEALVINATAEETISTEEEKELSVEQVQCDK